MRKRKILGNIACVKKIAAAVLLKLFMNSNERNHTTNPQQHEQETGHQTYTIKFMMKQINL